MITTVALTFAQTAPGSAALSASDGPKRTLTGLAVPFGVASKPDLFAGKSWIFEGPPANIDDLIDVVDEHNPDALCGRLAEPFSITQDGMHGVARIFATTRGNDLLVEAAEGAKTGFSIMAAIDTYTQDAAGVCTVAAGDWTAVHLGVVRNPAFVEASGLVAASTRKETHMPTETPIQDPPAPSGVGVVELPTIAELAAQLLPTLREMLDEPEETASILAQFSTRGEALHAMFAASASGDDTRAGELRAAFAAVNQMTTDNPGLIGMPPWARSLKANYDRRRPLITGTGGAIPLPEAGMSAQWPYFNGNLDTIIAQQLAEKNELNSVKISILAGSAPIKTAGVYSDISYQLLLRSSPSYLAAYSTICEAAWDRYTEAKYEAALVAGGTAIVPTSAVTFAGMTGVLLRALLWEASAAVEDATGSPASIVGVSSDVWRKLGTLTDLPNGKDGVQTNAAGSADASTLTVQIGGLKVVRAPFLAAKTVVATNDTAAKFAETGPQYASQEDVTKLGRDVAVWGMYEDAEVYFPAGVVKYVMA